MAELTIKLDDGKQITVQHDIITDDTGKRIAGNVETQGKNLDSTLKKLNSAIGTLSRNLNSSTKITKPAAPAATGKTSKDLLGAFDKVSDEIKKNSTIVSKAAKQANQKSLNTSLLKDFDELSGNLDASSSKFGIFAKVLGGGSKIIGGIFSWLGKTVKSVAGALYTLATGVVSGLIIGLSGLSVAAIDFTNQLITGNVKLSAFFETLARGTASIPIFGGIIATLIGVVGGAVKQMEHLRDVQADLSESGASFNNNLTTLRSAAAIAGLDLDDFASAIKSNSEGLARFGTVTAGAQKFAGVTKILREDLRNMGFSVRDISDQLPLAMDILSSGSIARGESESQLAESAKALLSEMDAMAKLTGKSRKSQIDAQRKTANEVAVRMKMASLSEQQQRALNEQMAQARAQFGDVGAEMIKLRLLGLPPLTEETRIFASLMGSSADALYSYTDRILQGGRTFTHSVEEMDEATVKSILAAGNSADSIRTILAAAGAGLGGSAQTILKNYEQVMLNQLETTGKIDEGKLRQVILQMRIEQKARDATIANLNKAEDAFMKVREALLNRVLFPLWNKFSPVIFKITDKIVDYTQLLTSNIDGVVKFFSEIYDKYGTKIVNGFKFIGDFLISQGPAIMDGFKAIGDVTVDLIETIGSAWSKGDWQEIFKAKLVLILTDVGIELMHVLKLTSDEEYNRYKNMRKIQEKGEKEQEQFNTRKRELERQQLKSAEQINKFSDAGKLIDTYNTLTTKQEELVNKKEQALILGQTETSQEIKDINQELANVQTNLGEITTKLEKYSDVVTKTQVKDEKPTFSIDTTQQYQIMTNTVDLQNSIADITKEANERAQANLTELKTAPKPSESVGLFQKENLAGAGSVAWKGATYGAMLGGAIGSFVPILGSAIGAAAGGALGTIIGGGVGLYGSMKARELGSRFSEGNIIGRAESQQPRAALALKQRELEKINKLEELIRRKKALEEEKFFKIPGAREGVPQLDALSNNAKLLKNYNEQIKTIDDQIDTTQKEISTLTQNTEALKNVGSSYESLKSYQRTLTDEISKLTTEINNLRTSMQDVDSISGGTTVGSSGGTSYTTSTKDSALTSTYKNEPISKILNSGSGFIDVETTKGQKIRRIGDPNIRNNNPGNIVYTELTKKLGAIGQSGRFAVFPTLEKGREALYNLLFENSSKIQGGLPYKERSIASAMKVYAPTGDKDNNPEKYAQTIANALNTNTSTILNTLSNDQRQKMMDIISRQEGSSNLKIDELSSRLYGSIGMTGKAFENFGRESIVKLHGLEGVFTPDQMRSIVTESQQRLAQDFAETINKNNTNVVTAKIDQDSLNSIRRENQEIASLLKQVTEILETSNRIQRTIADNT